MCLKGFSLCSAKGFINKGHSRGKMSNSLLKLSLVIVLVGTAGCSVGMAMSGKKDPNLGAFHAGSSRGEVELQMGSPTKTVANADGTRTDIYEYEIGNEPSAGRAVGHAVMDLLTLGIWEVIGTPVEAFQGEKHELIVHYDRKDKVVGINSRRLEPEEVSDEEAMYTSSDSSPQTNSSQTPDVDAQLEESIQDLVSQLSDGLKKHRVAFVAVLPVSDASDSVTTPLGNYLTEKISSGLYSTGDVKVIERSQLTKVVDELELTMGGKFDDASVKRIGRLLAVDAVVMGSYAELGVNTVEVNSRVVNVETAEVLGVGTIRIPKVFVRQLL